MELQINNLAKTTETTPSNLASLPFVTDNVSRNTAEYFETILEEQSPNLGEDLDELHVTKANEVDDGNVDDEDLRTQEEGIAYFLADDRSSDEERNLADEEIPSRPQLQDSGDQRIELFATKQAHIQTPLPTPEFIDEALTTGRHQLSSSLPNSLTGDVSTGFILSMQIVQGLPQKNKPIVLEGNPKVEIRKSSNQVTIGQNDDLKNRDVQANLNAIEEFSKRHLPVQQHSTLHYEFPQKQNEPQQSNSTNPPSLGLAGNHTSEAVELDLKFGTKQQDLTETPRQSADTAREEMPLHSSSQRDTRSITTLQNTTSFAEKMGKTDSENNDSKDAQHFRVDTFSEVRKLSHQQLPIANVKAELPAPVTNQILETIQARMVTEKSIEITLNPSELGRLKLSLSPAENGLIVNILAERAETLEIIKRNLSDLEQAFREQGHEKTEFSFEQNDQFLNHDHHQNSEGTLTTTNPDEENSHSPVGEAIVKQVITNTSGIDMRV